MIKVEDLCDTCKYARGVKNYHPFCDAFPEGIPYDHYLYDDKKNHCNNGIKYEQVDETDIRYKLYLAK